MPNRIHDNWLRVSKQNPCPICGKPDWCLISQDGKAAICARCESDKPAGSKGAGWLHKLHGSSVQIQAKPKQKVIQITKVRPSFLDIAYRALLQERPLSTAHRNHLLHRGLTEIEIVGLGYGTLKTNGRDGMVKKLQTKVRLYGVPGFYQENDSWCLAGPAGIAIPVKDTRKRIVGLQIRCDDAERSRYKWLSSRGYHRGCSSGSPVHVAGRITPGNEIWITEGPIKADIAAMKLDRTVLAVAGVGNWPGVIPILRELKPKRVIVAFDMDKNTNPAVKVHADTLTKCLVKEGIRTFEANWDNNYKGIDDLLTGSNTW